MSNHQTVTAPPPPETAANAPSTLIGLRQVSIRFTRTDRPDLVICEGLDRHVNSGEVVCIAGRSGSGKTSILRVAAGLAPPHGGSVAWAGSDLGDLSADELAQRRRRFCGIVDQRASLLPDFTALENVLIPAIPGGKARRHRGRAEQLLTELGLAEHINSFPATLSGGERQRVALCRALLLEPAALIIDEPTASLDRAIADQVIDLLGHLAASGTGVLVASHDPHLIDRSRVALTLS